MKISKQARRGAKQLFNACLIGGIPDDERVKKTVRSLIASKPRGYMGILNHLHRLVKLDVQKRSATVESAIEMSDEQKSEIQQNLSKIYPEGLEVSYQVNPELHGGLRVKVGSDVFDSSIRGKLNAIRDNF